MFAKSCAFWTHSLHCAHLWVLCYNGRPRTDAVHLPYFLGHTCMVLQHLTLTQCSLVMPCPEDTIGARVTHPSHTLLCTSHELPPSDHRILPRRSSYFLILWGQPTHAVCASGLFCSHEWCILLPSPFATPLPHRIRSRSSIAL